MALPVCRGCNFGIDGARVLHRGEWTRDDIGLDCDADWCGAGNAWRKPASDIKLSIRDCKHKLRDLACGSGPYVCLSTRAGVWRAAVPGECKFGIEWSDYLLGSQRTRNDFRLDRHPNWHGAGGTGSDPVSER